MKDWYVSSKFTMKEYMLRVLPEFLPKTHSYIQCAHQEEEVKVMTSETKVNMIKPGKDFYTVSFTITLSILIFMVINFSTIFNNK